MKIPEKQRRYCPNCDKHTEHKVRRESQGPRLNPSAHSKGERKARRREKGYGNSGKSSKQVSGEKPTRRVDLRYKCKECGKEQTVGRGFRVKRLEIER